MIGRNFSDYHAGQLLQNKLQVEGKNKILEHENSKIFFPISNFTQSQPKP
jgi:hypothetical protein